MYRVLYFNRECFWFHANILVLFNVEIVGLHPLVTSTTPDVSLKHTDTGGDDDEDDEDDDDDDKGVLENESR